MCHCRKFVSCTSLSKAISDVNQMKTSPEIERILELRANRERRPSNRTEERPLFNRKRKLSGEIEDRADTVKQRKLSGEGLGKTSTVRQRKPSGEEKGKAKNTRARKPSGEGMKSITNYFKPSQNKSQTESRQEPTIKDLDGNKKLIVNVIDEELGSFPRSDVPTSPPPPLHSSMQFESNHEVVNPANEVPSSLAKEESNENPVEYMNGTIIAVSEDSGVSFSAHSPPDTNKVQDRYKGVDNNERPLFSEQCQTKVPSSSSTNLGDLSQHFLKHEVNSNPDQHIVVCPVTVKNESNEDMFDSNFDDLDIDFSRMEKDIPSRKPASEEEVKESNFDLGSPILEEDIADVGKDTNNKSIFKSNGDFFNFEEKIDFDPSSKGTSTSTPIHPVKAKEREGSLRRSVLPRKLEPEPEKKTNISEDMFNDSEEFDFSHLDYGQKPEVDDSLYSATDLLKMINESPEEYSKHKLQKKKLSTIFADTTVDEEEPPKTDAKQEEVNTSVDIFEGEPTFDFGSQDFMVEEPAWDNKIIDLEKNGLSPDPEEGPSWKFDSRARKDNSGLDPGEGHSRDILKNDGVIEDPGEGTSRNGQEDQLKQTCVVCYKVITGDNDYYNEHLDMCLNKSTITELTQQNFDPNTSPQRDPSPDSSFDFDSPPRSPKAIAERNKKIDQILARQSFSITQAKVDAFNAFEDNEPPIFKPKSKKKKPCVNMFLDVEADMSGDDHSEDEKEESVEHYEESFVDDASQETDQAVYLRSVKSPEFRKPFSRPLAPITDDIFSQKIDRDIEDQYEEDSFCMADSFVEDDSHYDTLDLLEKKAEDIRHNRKRLGTEENDLKKRKRIIAATSSDDDSIVQDENERKEDIPKKRKRIISLLSSDEESCSNDCIDVTKPKEAPVPTTVAKNVVDLSDEEYLSESMIEAKKMAVIVSNSEVFKANDLISNLRLVLGFNVIVPKRSVEFVTFVTGRYSGAIRMSEANFSNGANKDKLIKTLKEAKQCYRDLALILEREKVKPGERPKSKRRTKVFDKTLCQVMKTSIRLFYSGGEEDSAAIVAKLVETAVSNGEGLPRQQFSSGQEKMVDWLRILPGVGMGVAYQLSVSFSTMKELLSASKATIMSRGFPDNVASTLVKNFHGKFNPADRIF